MKKPQIGITMGDPKGIGPEVVQKALASREIRKICEPVLFGPSEFFDWKKTKTLSDKECGRLSHLYIRQAVRAAMQRKIAAIVTGPISKANLNKAGYHYPGHTELLAELTGTKKVVMMMSGPQLKVSLVTIHEPLAKVPKLLTEKNIFETIELTNNWLKKYFGIKKPKLAVAGLNPHAGEGGIFGPEEKKIIQPAVLKACRQKINVAGPLSADSLFHKAANGRFDAVIAMYHDQGLIPLKLLHFEEGVNIILGLPIIRTSPDHGTAFDIAGRGIASPQSMIAAIRMAVEMVQHVY
ncbi:MAG: 4-hydroxythreonine-4-phosphate dehydrogenase PdxA [Deltaproteobacteria bacterium]|nr:4-hydroxythreonine-4-phosphate dehydrogenase PdxA [Deltaproteobacteria bacterium]